MAKTVQTRESNPVADFMAREIAKGKPGHKSLIKVAIEQDEPMEQGLTLKKSVQNLLNSTSEIERLAFEENPQLAGKFEGIIKRKQRLLPDEMLKRIAIQDDLVAAIVNTRANQISCFGRKQPDRHSTGFKYIPDAGILDKMTEEERSKFQQRVDRLERMIGTCGNTNRWSDQEKMGFSQYLAMSARNAVIVGRIATEIIWTEDARGQKVFHSFRPIDAGTIFRTANQTSSEEKVRQEAFHKLQALAGEKKLVREKFDKNQYAWVQAIENTAVQVFTEDECVVHNFYPVTDVELLGYPVTPLDTVMAAVTTHLNITTHNRLYFQHGRASRGMLIIKSDDVSEETISRVRQQFQASINNVGNSWRMPVFGVGEKDDIVWAPIDNGGRDMEFQYLSDTTSRVILSAFQMSPEELPGYAHLSRGTNSQALSESNGEYKLEAARDVGIRPLMSGFQDFINQRLVPLIDDGLAKSGQLKFVGLDAETPEKESVRLQQDMGVHMTFDEVLDKVEKKPVGMEMGGQIPLNALYNQLLDKYFTVGQILERFCGVKDASKNPQLAYMRDPFFFEWQQLQMQKEQMQAQAQAQQQQAQQGGQPGQGGDQPPPDDGGGGGQRQTQQQPQEAPGQGDFTSTLDQVLGALSKSEDQLPPAKKKLLARQRMLVDAGIKGLEDDLKETMKTILEVAYKHTPKA